MLILPGSCVALVADRFGSVFLFGLAILAGSLLSFRTWKCPRCSSPFGRVFGFPFVRPFAGACQYCGLPEFVPSQDLAPPPVGPQAESADKSPQKLSLLKDPRARVSLIIAIPLIWMSMCRLPAGERVKLSSGREVRVIDITKNWQSTLAGGKSYFLALTYYAPRSPGDVKDDELLSLTIPAVKATGDSTVVLNEIRGDWWERASGIHVTMHRTYRLSHDGKWNPE